MVDKILVVDDDTDVTNFISTALESAGYAVDCRTSANGIVEYIRASSPDLVLLDYRLPGLDGIMALNMLRSNNLFMPIVMLTSDASQQIAVASFRSGASDFLPKPCEADYLESVVRRTLENRTRYLSQAVSVLSEYLTHKPGCGFSESGECRCGLAAICEENGAPIIRR